jgi:hypothetical protein
MKRHPSVQAVVGLLSAALTAAGAQWTQTTSLPNFYSAQSLAYWSGFLYQAGGNSNDNGLADGFNVFYAQVHTNGTLGTWIVATPLPDAVNYHAGVAANGFLYVLGGYHWNDQVGVFIANIVYYARINSDGSNRCVADGKPVARCAVVFECRCLEGPDLRGWRL